MMKYQVLRIKYLAYSGEAAGMILTTGYWSLRLKGAL